MRCLWVVIALAACSTARRPDGSDTDAGSDPQSDGNNTNNGDAPPGNPGQITIYAHDATALYTVDPDTYAVTRVAAFGLTGLLEEMTDLGIDQNGNLIGTSFAFQLPTGMMIMNVYTVDPTTAQCTLLTTSTRTCNGLSFVPASAVGGTGADVLVCTEAAGGAVWKIDPTNGNATQVGSMGGSYVSSGDIVSVVGFGTVQTVKGATRDVLVKLDPVTFTAHPIGTDTGFDKIWGVGFWKDKVFGFTNLGQIITIDPNTGVGTEVANGGPQWYGAAVTTVAPILL